MNASMTAWTLGASMDRVSRVRVSRVRVRVRLKGMS